jgi:hypothetical protein
MICSVVSPVGTALPKTGQRIIILGTGFYWLKKLDCDKAEGNRIRAPVIRPDKQRAHCVLIFS